MTELRSERGWRIAFFLLGLAISITELTRCRVNGDVLGLLARGWLLVEKEIWVPYGAGTSAGGTSPGGLTSLLVGVPLFFWRDHRAPVVLILLSHIAAYVLLDRLVRETLSTPHRLVFCAVYWLNPWRVYFSGHLSNIGYLFFFGALHAWTSYRLRSQPHFWASFLHVSAITFPFQLHSSGIVLPVVSGVMLYRRMLRLHWVGAACAALLVAVSLVPWWVEVTRNSAILPGRLGFPLRGLIFVFPLLRGILYWLRYASLAVAERMVSFGSAGRLAEFVPWFVTEVVTCLSVLPSICASVWLWRRIRRHHTREVRSELSGRIWLEEYVAWTFIGAVICFCLSPTTIMFWQGVVFLHAAVLPLVLWVTVLLRSRIAPQVRPVARLWVALCALQLLAITFNSPMYREAGRDDSHSVRLADHPMLHDLRIVNRYGVVIDPAAVWKPDVLREPPIVHASH